MRHSEQSSDWRLCTFLFLQVFNITFKRRICLPDFADIAFSNLRWIAQDLVTFAGFSARLQLETSRPSPAQLSVCLSVCLSDSLDSLGVDILGESGAVSPQHHQLLPRLEWGPRERGPTTSAGGNVMSRHLRSSGISSSGRWRCSYDGRHGLAVGNSKTSSWMIFEG